MERARRLGILGPGPIDRHVRHAHGFARVLAKVSVHSPSDAGTGGDGDAAPPVVRLVDLGSGGGVPGLVVAADLPAAHVVLVEANGRRAALLGDAIVRCGMDARVEVLHARAEDVARRGDRRGRFDAALARGFGRPAVTAECAAPLLRLGGVLVVSEPPDAGACGERQDPTREGPVSSRPPAAAGPDRWPADGLARLGLVRGPTVHDEFTYQVVIQQVPCPERYPRRTGIPAKRPLF